MKSQPAEALDVVEGDIRAAQEYYASWRADGLEYFKSQFDETIRWIEWNPELFPKRYRFFRRVIIRNTFYAVFYVIEPNVTTIVAVMDMRQRPKTVKGLVSGRTRQS